MTSLAFIFGVAPLVVATGAGSEMRQSLGTAVFAGMLGVTLFGLLFTPAFYTVASRIGRKKSRAGRNETALRAISLRIAALLRTACACRAERFDTSDRHCPILRKWALWMNYFGTSAKAARIRAQERMPL